MVKKLISFLVALTIVLGIIPFSSISVYAESYYSESDLSNIKCSILSNSQRANYVNSMMKKHILSSTDDYRVARNLQNGKSVVFFFDGCSDNVDDPTYGDYTKYHLSAYCAVVKEVNGVLKVVYESENCSTIPDNPRNASLNEGTDVPTVLDGIYNIYSTNHLSKYAALHIANNSGVAPAIRCNWTSSYIDSSVGINIHARSKFSNVAHNGISLSTYSSTGCFNVGLTNDSWSEYNAFIYAVLGVSNARNVLLSSTGADKGVVIVDRSQYKAQLTAIYGGDNSNTASALVSKITAYTDGINNTQHTTHTYTSTYWEAAHPHRVYQQCSCGQTRYVEGEYHTYTDGSCAECMSCTCSTSYAGEYTTKNVDSTLTIRSGHGTSYSVLGSIPANAKFTVSKANGSWAHITYNGISGYVSYEYIQKVQSNQKDTRYPTPFMAYCVSEGNVTAYDSVNGTTVGNIYGDEDFCEILEVYTNGWCKVKCPWSGYSDGRIVYVKFSVFLSSSTSVTPKTAIAVNKTAAYYRAGGTGSPGYVYVNDECVIVGESGSQYCIICPWTTSDYSGKYMVWCDKSAFVHNHSYGNWGNYDSSYHSRECSCGVIEKASHTWNGGQVTTSASCEGTGTKKYTCTVCAATKTETIAATGHTYNQGVITTQPTCTKTGIKTYTCSSCGSTKTETIAKTSHNYSVKNTSKEYLKSSATCVSFATYYYSCSCGLIGTESFTSGEPLGHAYGDSQYDEAHPHAIYQVCTRCEYKNYTGEYQNISSCDECNPVKTIAIYKLPDKTVYKISDSFDSTGMTLLIVYDDNSTETITSGFAVSGFDSSTAGVKTITVTYAGKTTTFAVAVSDVDDDYLAGDIDVDGEISDWDAIVLERYLAGWSVEINLNSSDVDGDGEVNDWDAILLNRYLAGWEIGL